MKKRSDQAPQFLLPESLVDRTLDKYEQNILVQWLLEVLPQPKNHILETLKKYKVGTASGEKVKGWSIFWQIDEKGGVRTGKLIKYAPNGRRDKTSEYHIDWVHSMLKRSKKLKNFELVQCLFGLHTIINNDFPVAIVESEKTAIILKMYFPNINWLATGQKNGLNLYKITPLKARKIILFPDSGCFDEWNQFAKREAKDFSISTSDILEDPQYSTCSGADIADFLIKN
jgi:hypothetical protein